MLLWQTLNCATVVAYCRPFSGNDRRTANRVPDLPTRFVKILTSEERKIHTLAMQDRNTLLAHSDSDAWNMRPIFVETAPGRKVLLPLHHDVRAPLVHEVVERLNAICGKLMDLVFEERMKLEKELADMLPSVSAENLAASGLADDSADNDAVSGRRINMDFAKFEPISIRNHPELNERWVQDRIAEDPSILGLGDVVLKDRERIQPKAGRLDLLLQDAESSRRYEVEIQLGATDESHIIRTIEYWDIERKRYPQYEHTAVIVAEDITSRFLNVINLFNGTIPLIAIQMRALQSGGKVGLVFTTVVDLLSLGLVDEDGQIRKGSQD